MPKPRLHALMLLCLFLAPAGLAPRPAAARSAAGATSPMPSAIAIGASSFDAALPGGETIKVFTYRAARHGPADPIVIVLAGGGRNGDDYRDAWRRAADRFGLLVLAPSFDEAQFPGAISYNLAGMIGDRADVATLRDVSLTAVSGWLFADIEAIFDAAVARTGSAQTRYDLFGHSAGGQIVHRLAMFAPEARVRTAVAANSGWYTTPDATVRFPYGLGGVALPAGQLDRAFARRLVLLLGELDNEQETRGHLRETPEADAQGPHRLARGQHFHAVAERERARRGVASVWEVKLVPAVGHDYRKMADAAADYLYGRR